jgi:hypothetical protein
VKIFNIRSNQFLVTFLFVLNLISTSSFGYIFDNVLQCATSFHKDSFFMGVNKEFNNEDTRFTPMSRDCLSRGQAHAQRLLSTLNSFQIQNCHSDYFRAISYGLRLATSRPGASECFQLGYLTGEAKLNIAIRSGDTQTAGYDCVTNYNLGLADGSNMRRPSRAFANQRVRYCYELGLFEASSL